jgi:outer membrane lipoprotein-sorting protein
MRQKSSPFRAFFKAALIGSALFLFIVLSLGAPSTAQTQRNAQSRQLEQVEPINQWPSKAKRWALVIGVDDYKDGQISPLKGSANDARMLADALVRYAGFPQDQVILMSTDQPDERQPTRVNILRRLSNLASVVPKDGLLLVSFAGHGMERNGQAYLLPSDAQISDDITFLEETAVSVARMKERIRATGVGQVVVLLDACRNDPGGRADAPNPLTTAYTKFNFDVRNREVQAFATFYATAVGQRAYEYTEKHQGYFTWAVVEGIKGGAANEKGEVTLANLVKYVQESVPKRIGIDLGGGKQQKPFAIIEGYRAEDLVVAVSANGMKTDSIETASSSSADPAALESRLWDAIKDSTDPADFQAYLDKYPNGTFATVARKRAQPTSSSGLPPVEKIVESYIQALGTRTALGKVQTIAMKGVMEVRAGDKTYTGTMETLSKLPDKAYSITKIPKLNDYTEEGYDGSVAWYKDKKGVKVKEGWALEFVRRNAEISYMTDIKQFQAVYPKAVVTGSEKIGSYDTYVVRVTPSVGQSETLYFDKETGLVVRWDFIFESTAQKGATASIQMYVDSYADVEGLKFPSSIRQVSNMITYVTQFFDIKYNVPVDETKFSKPSK